MKKAKVIYCMDGYHSVEIPIKSLDELLFAFERIKSEALVERKVKVIFSVDVVIEDVGRISVGLDQRCILSYTSEDFEKTLTSLGDENAEGETEYYFGDYTLMSNKYIIPCEDAIKVLDIWINSGKVSDSIKWTDKLF